MDFDNEVSENIRSLNADAELWRASVAWMSQSARHKYTYNFSWLGRPIIQSPQDIVQIQELAWKTKPQIIVETGIARGGSLMLSASILALLDFAEARQEGRSFNPSRPKRKVIGIDIDIRTHNRVAIESHPLSGYIHMIEGSSIEPTTIAQVSELCSEAQSIMVILDSNHTHEHVLEELRAYAPLTSLGSYCVVFDTLVEDLPKALFPNRPWGPGNNPKTAVYAFLEECGDFEIESQLNGKLQLTVAPDGYLRRVRKS